MSSNGKHPLQKYCKKYEIPQVEFYEKIGVTKQTWFKWLRRDAAPSLKKALVIHYMTCGEVSLIELLTAPQDFRNENCGLIDTTNRVMGIRKRGLSIADNEITDEDLL